jgi:hypothetical protein
VDVVLVEPWIGPVVGELELELFLFLRYRQSAHGTGRADTVASPCAVRRAARELAAFDDGSGFLAEHLLVRHVTDLDTHSTLGCAT